MLLERCHDLVVGQLAVTVLVYCFEDFDGKLKLIFGQQLSDDEAVGELLDVIIHLESPDVAQGMLNHGVIDLAVSQFCDPLVVQSRAC